MKNENYEKLFIMMKYLLKRNNSTLVSFLSLSGIRHTNEFTNKYFNEHPHKYNLYGLSQMLTYYGVRNMGIKISNKEDIHLLELPFIAHIGNDFVTVERVSQNTVSYYWHRKKMAVSLKDFFDLWSGTALIAEADAEAVEPNYKQHRKEELITIGLKCLLLLIGVIIGGIGIYQNLIYQNPGLVTLLLLNITGVYIGYLLVQKQIHIHSNVADKICSLFTKGDCNDILNSPAAKFMGVVGWSELGLSYFISNTFILLFTPHLLYYLVLLTICVLPYSFWSIWYQKFKARTWCPLCLIVQALFWLLFMVELISGFIQVPDFTTIHCLMLGTIYVSSFILISHFIKHQISNKKLIEVTQHFNRLKMNDKFFLALLKEQIFYNIDDNQSKIKFGDPNAKNVITVFSNPHCGPCAEMHKKIMKLLKDVDNQFCIQYILSSFDSTLYSSCEFLLFVNKSYSTKERNEIYDKWFEKGKFDRENFFRRYSFVAKQNIVSEEFQEHLEWQKKTKLQATPTVIFNGYELPDLYFQQIDKLSAFANLEMNFK